GPGHGKAVISSYVLANERTVRRGIILAFLAAFVQAMTAIVLVSALALVFKASGMTMKWAVNWLETASYALIAAVGAWMLVTQLRKALRRPATAEPMAAPAPHRHVAHAELAASHHGHAHAHAHDCGHDHHHQHGHHHHGHGDATRAPHPAHVHHDDCCGHAHMPSPQQLEGAWNTRKALAMAFAVGVRPCTGAVLVLVFALTQGLFWAGVGATFAMALGTAITVSVLAALAVGSRELAIKLTGGEGPWARRVHAIAGIGGSVLVLMLGVLFLIGSITQPTVF
ncbi:MAG: nickel/cobalt transporter, partial [Caldilineaceae bacterium]|nr:nickel/cobalt transporter [Caldilineaceae bacterium]